MYVLRLLTLGPSGTSLEADARLSLRKTYEQIVSPVVQQRSALFPEDSGSFDTFANVAGIVQSRMFHLEKENWVTGSKSAGNTCIYKLPIFLEPKGSTAIGESFHGLLTICIKVSCKRCKKKSSVSGHHAAYQMTVMWSDS